MPTITPQIVTVDATVTAAPVASGFQQTGAIVSEGGSTLTTNTYQYCGTLAQVSALLSGSGNHAELLNMATTHFAQGNAVGLYVLELGTVANPAAGIAALQTWITANPSVFYAYLVPEDWDTAGSTLNTMAANYSSPTGMTYFFVTSTSSTITAYSATTKSIFAVCEAPTAPSTEFTAAAFFYQWLANNPSAANPAPPMAFRFAYGVTAWSLANNLTTIETILTAYGNLILTGAEGGISTATLRNGTTMDGNQSMFWYDVDWAQINAKLQLANAVINGSNENPPLYYNQNGINRLLAVLQGIGAAGISFGLLLNAVFSATTFAAYTAANPGDYAAGVYKGFSAVLTPQLGFLQIFFYIDATQFAG